MLHGMSQALHVYIIAQNIALGNSLTIQRITDAYELSSSRCRTNGIAYNKCNKRNINNSSKFYCILNGILVQLYSKTCYKPKITNAAQKITYRFYLQYKRISS